MPRTDRDGRTVRLTLSRLLSRNVHDSEIADALGLPVSTYSKRKDKPDFPNFDELRQLAERLGVDGTILEVDFGYLDVADLNDRLQQRYAAYRNAVEVIASMRQGPSATTTTTTREGGAASKQPPKRKRPPRIDGASPRRPL